MTKPAQPVRLHATKLSGHCHRVELMLNLLGLPYDYRPVDLHRGEHKAPDFLKLNPFGTVPVIEDGATVIADSVAAIVYLAGTYDADGVWLPRDPTLAARVQFWLSAAQGPVFNGPCAARLVKRFGADVDYDRARRIAEGFLGVLEAALAGGGFLAGGGPTVADVAIYSYVAAAPEGGLDLAPYPATRAWLGRVAALPGFVAMPEA